MGQNFCIPDESPKNNPFEIDGQEIETTLKQSKINECLPNDYEKKQITQQPLLRSRVAQALKNQKRSSLIQQTDQSVIYDKNYYKFERTGNVYSGQWKGNLPHGKGIMHFPKGNIYEGSFIEGVPFGIGRLIMVNGAQFEGQLRFGRANGEGRFTNHGYSYRGQFKDDCKHGHGEQTELDKYYFKGEFVNGERVKGLLKYGDNFYEGQFFDEFFDGKGKLIDDCGNQYEGEFKGGNLHGYGVYTWKDGSMYRGYYVKGLREGQGQFFNAKNSSISRGLWKQGVLNGEGEYQEGKGRTTRCVWNAGKMIDIQA